MSLNIKNETTHRLERELVTFTGENVIDAVTVVVRERLERLQRKGGKRLLGAVALDRQGLRRPLREPYRSINHAMLLCDERGLPR